MQLSLEEQQNKLSPVASAELSERARTEKSPSCPHRTGRSAGRGWPSPAVSFPSEDSVTQPCARLFQCNAAQLCTLIYILRNIRKIWTLSCKGHTVYVKESVTVWFRLKMIKQRQAGPLGLPAMRILQYCPQAAQPILTLYAKFVLMDQIKRKPCFY